MKMILVLMLLGLVASPAIAGHVYVMDRESNNHINVTFEGNVTVLYEFGGKQMIAENMTGKVVFYGSNLSLEKYP